MTCNYNGFWVSKCQWFVMAVVAWVGCQEISLAQVQSNPSKSLQAVKSSKLGETKNVHICGNLYTAGQFSESDVDAIKNAGIVRVITLRKNTEVSWDEKKLVENSGMKFQSIPFYYPDSLTDDVFDQVRKVLSDKKSKTLLHCGAASRVAAVWLPFRVLDEGQPLEVALKEAKQIGRLPKTYESKALAYIAKKQEQESQSKVPEGINKAFLDPNMNVDRYLKLFEVESREIFTTRYELLKACKVAEDAIVADVGAGTGLFSRLFSIQAKKGWVYAVDIAPRFLDHIRADSKKFGIQNVTPVLCQEDSINLPPKSVDFVFICDTYHHFEFPQKTLRTIQAALRDKGTLVVVDFERIPGVTRPWLLKHVRAGKEVFRKEVQDAGFQFVEEVEIPGLKENYFLRFKKVSDK